MIVFGDWHGNTDYALQALQTVPEDHAIIHVGDFGFWPGGWEFLQRVNDRTPGILYVVPGNHEYWDELRVGGKEYRFETDSDGLMVSPLYPNLRVVDRVAVWTLGGKTVAALSGANSIDFQYRKIGRSWWPQESPRMEHVDALWELCTGEPVHVLVTHDAPSSAIEALNLYPKDRSGSGWSDIALSYASESARIIESARQRLRPDVHVCGHHHVRRSVRVDGVQVEFLGSDDGPFEKNRIVL